jgi:hypothetical protein
MVSGCMVQGSGFQGLWFHGLWFHVPVVPAADRRRALLLTSGLPLPHPYRRPVPPWERRPSPGVSPFFGFSLGLTPGLSRAQEP